MALDHFVNSRISRENHEVFTNNFFRATLIPPAGAASDSIVTEAILNVSGFKVPGPESVQQQFQIAKRNFASGEVDQTQNISITFQLNLNAANELYVYNIIQDWRQLVYDPLTGSYGLKANYTGQLIIENARRDGEIFWTRTLHNVWPSGELTGFTDLDYTSSDPQTLETTWIADYYTEARVQST